MRILPHYPHIPATVDGFSLHWQDRLELDDSDRSSSDVCALSAALVARNKRRTNESARIRHACRQMNGRRGCGWPARGPLAPDEATRCSERSISPLCYWPARLRVVPGANRCERFARPARPGLASSSSRPSTKTGVPFTITCLMLSGLRAGSRFEARCQWCLAEPATAGYCPRLRAAFADPRRLLGAERPRHSCAVARRECRSMMS